MLHERAAYGIDTIASTNANGIRKDQRAAEIDERPRPRLRLRVENVDANMTADLQRPGGGEQK